MKYLILLLLILSSCTDKKESQESTTQDMLIVFEDSEKLQTNTDPLIASYDIATNLVTLNSEYGLRVNPINSVYWDSNNNKYFKIVSTNIHSNIIFEFDNEKSTKHFYFNENITDGKIQYRGALSPNQLVYYNLKEDSTIIMTIEEIDDTFVEYWGGGAGRSDKLETNTNIFYPYRSGTYTNTSDSLQWWRGGKEFRLTPIDPEDY